MEKLFQRYFFVVLFALLFLCLPKSFTEKMKECGAGVGSFITYTMGGKKNNFEELESLKLENTLLSNQIQQVGDFLTSEDRIETQLKQLQIIEENKEKAPFSNEKEFFKRREMHLLKRLKKQLMSLSARVVFREPNFWGTRLWIDVGERDNKAVGESVIQVNSPVVIGNVVVGVVDYVGQKRSRVSLVTDSRLSLSVRALRGSEQNKMLLDHLEALNHQLYLREDLFFSLEEQVNTLKILARLEENLQKVVHDRYLAKGEIHGSSQPLWRSKAARLKGLGFNYDFEDVEGPARDLRTGERLDKKGDLCVLLKEGDLLMTTGLDGIYPEGFQVGVIESVKPLEEGACSYDLVAKSLIPDLDEIKAVTVLSAIEGDVACSN